jgi:hypothetical protein
MLEVSVLLFGLGLVCLWFVYDRLASRLQRIEDKLQAAAERINGYRG